MWGIEEDIENNLLLLAEFSVISPADEKEQLIVSEPFSQYQTKFEKNTGNNRNRETYVVEREKEVNQQVIKPGKIAKEEWRNDCELRKKTLDVSESSCSNVLIEQLFEAETSIFAKPTNSINSELIKTPLHYFNEDRKAPELTNEEENNAIDINTVI